MIKDGLGLVKAAKHCWEGGLMPGTSGNVSMRIPRGLLITPSGTTWSELSPSDLVELEPDGKPMRAFSNVPSSEWQLHVDLYDRRPEVNAIVHTHSRFATVISCLRRPIPAVHYMIAAAGVSQVRCADYATYGTRELGQNALRALEGAKACLLANHGLVALGATLKEATKVAFEIENVAALYWHALQAGQPVLLDDVEIKRVAEKLKGYGQPA
ncbi:MAG: class II aldolase/adducin family protein [Archangiaceae bacterium]|nr:class II aldolase/adducin family protein [Archangiaceae bacterium]